MSAYVYRITNTLDESIYIGATEQDPPIKRFKEHISDARRKRTKTHFHRAISKYGKENFTFEIILTVQTFEIALAEESKEIARARSAGIRLYNMTDGGEGGINHLTQEVRDRIGTKLRGRKLSEEHRKKISLGLNEPETKEKRSLTMSGRKLSEDHKKSISIGINRAHENDPSLRFRIPQNGENNARAKLTWNDVNEIRKRWNESTFTAWHEKMSFCEKNAQEFSVCSGQIYGIVTGTTWVTKEEKLTDKKLLDKKTIGKNSSIRLKNFFADPENRKIRQGENNGNARLTQNDVDTLRNMFTESCMNARNFATKMAPRFNVTSVSIFNAITYRTWNQTP